MTKRVKIEEQELLTLLISKSEDGFNILYDNYSAALFGVICRVIEHREIAEDLLQESFVKIWNNIHQYDPAKGRLFTWMINLARNISIDKLRSKEYQNILKNQDLEDSVHIFDQQQHASQNPDTIGLKNYVELLQPELKLIIELMYFKGYTQTEIAGEYQIPLGTVKTRARAALTRLRELLDEQKVMTQK